MMYRMRGDTTAEDEQESLGHSKKQEAQELPSPARSKKQEAVRRARITIASKKQEAKAARRARITITSKIQEA